MQSQILYRKIDENYVPLKWFCGNCGTIYSKEEDAEECCKPLICSKCGKKISTDRNQPLDSYYINPIRCSSCYLQEKEDSKPLYSFLEYNDEPILDEDRWFPDLDEFFEYYADEPENIPEFVEIGQYEPVAKIDYYSLIENLVERCCLDEDTDIECMYKDVDELREFIKTWNEKQTALLWTPSGKRLHINQEIKDFYQN